MIQEKVQQPGQRNKAVLGQKQLFIVSNFCGLLQIWLNNPSLQVSYVLFEIVRRDKPIGHWPDPCVSSLSQVSSPMRCGRNSQRKEKHFLNVVMLFWISNLWHRKRELEKRHLWVLKSYKTVQVRIQCFMAALAVSFDTCLIYKNHINLVLVYIRHSPLEDISALTDVKLQ